MSVIGTSRTSRDVRLESAKWAKARSAAVPRCAIPFAQAREVLGSETPRVHDAAWWRGGVAPRGSGAAGEATDCRVLGRQHTFGRRGAGGRIRRAAPRPRLD